MSALLFKCGFINYLTLLSLELKKKIASFSMTYRNSSALNANIKCLLIVCDFKHLFCTTLILRFVFFFSFWNSGKVLETSSKKGPQKIPSVLLYFEITWGGANALRSSGWLLLKLAFANKKHFSWRRQVFELYQLF